MLSSSDSHLLFIESLSDSHSSSICAKQVLTVLERVILNENISASSSFFTSELLKSSPDALADCSETKDSSKVVLARVDWLKIEMRRAT